MIQEHPFKTLLTKKSVVRDLELSWFQSLYPIQEIDFMGFDDESYVLIFMCENETMEAEFFRTPQGWRFIPTSFSYTEKKSEAIT